MTADFEAFELPDGVKLPRLRIGDWTFTEREQGGVAISTDDESTFVLLLDQDETLSLQAFLGAMSQIRLRRDIQTSVLRHVRDFFMEPADA